jgi:hypothetical protein
MLSRPTKTGVGRLTLWVRTAIGVGGAALLLSACATSPKVTLDLMTTSAVVEAGSEVRIDVGSSNGSVGDSWRLGDIFPSGSVSSVKRDYQSDCEELVPGCGGQLAFVIQNSDDIPDGKIMFTVKHCYQGACPEDPRATPGSKSFKYELTVVNQR